MTSLVDRLAIGQTFDSLAEFEEVFHKYQEETFVAFSKSNGCRKLSSNYSQEHQDTIQYEEVRFRCKQGGKYRGYQGKGIRMNSCSLKVGCDAFISLRIQKSDDGRLRLRVRSRNLTHTNHEVGPEYAMRYPEFRRFEMTDEVTEMMRNPLISNAFIMDHIQKTQNKVVHITDLRNIRRKVKEGRDVISFPSLAPKKRKKPVKSESDDNEGGDDAEESEDKVENGEGKVENGQDKVENEEDGIENGEDNGEQTEKNKKKYKAPLRLLNEVQYARYVAPLVERGWTLSGNNDALQREFIFGDFNEAFRFITGVAMEGHRIQHYPEWYNCENKVDITLQTRSRGGLTGKDVRLAHYIDSLTE